MSNIQPEVLKTLRSAALDKINQGKKRTHSVNLDFTEYDPSFTGRITFHYPTQLESIQIGVTKAGLLGGLTGSVDVLTENTAHIIATLDIVIDEKPDWFDANNIDLDYDILERVFIEFNNWRDSFRKGRRESEPQGDSQATQG